MAAARGAEVVVAVEAAAEPEAAEVRAVEALAAESDRPASWSSQSVLQSNGAELLFQLLGCRQVTANPRARLLE